MKKTIEVFTVEEINLLCICSRESPSALLRDLKNMLSGTGDTDLRTVICSSAKKLSQLTEDEYAVLIGELRPAQEA